MNRGNGQLSQKATDDGRGPRTDLRFTIELDHTPSLTAGSGIFQGIGFILPAADLNYTKINRLGCRQ